jgi:hypothetical protein
MLAEGTSAAQTLHGCSSYSLLLLIRSSVIDPPSR